MAGVWSQLEPQADQISPVTSNAKQRPSECPSTKLSVSQSILKASDTSCPEDVNHNLHPSRCKAVGQAAGPEHLPDTALLSEQSLETAHTAAMSADQAFTNAAQCAAPQTSLGPQAGTALTTPNQVAASHDPQHAHTALAGSAMPHTAAPEPLTLAVGLAATLPVSPSLTEAEPQQIAAASGCTAQIPSHLSALIPNGLAPPGPASALAHQPLCPENCNLCLESASGTAAAAAALMPASPHLSAKSQEPAPAKAASADCALSCAAATAAGAKPGSIATAPVSCAAAAE